MKESKLTQSIRQARAEGRTALIPYIPAGFPGLQEFWNVLAELDAAGADVIEIGVPFSDPVADGPTVEQASLECIERGVTLSWILTELEGRRAGIRAAIVLMGYVNPFFRYGYERLAKDAARAGVDGFIVPDLPFEESGDLRAALADTGIALVPLVGLNTPAERMKLYTKGFGGFCYVVSVMGVTGERVDISGDVARTIAEARACFDIPVALGFGLKTPDQLAAMAEKPDAAVFGSSLITHLRGGGSAGEFMKVWTGR
ncbi:tryptophan synthase alpha chain [Desulfobaculum xiamenense]|uniref:Tryptophan synthase alpha chain n=1 Tax=Desulfobaculum xiamenense TaxID=995050 RepID=A0A846QUE9_9BACT|nr:tryptophan synthase subunit alpha [Desulfobaculum xiamenense]NJB68269.1 tryptophan synthase alpha chain [Desulfobaculum xiamenense]